MFSWVPEEEKAKVEQNIEQNPLPNIKTEFRVGGYHNFKCIEIDSITLSSVQSRWIKRLIGQKSIFNKQRL